jgi:hypothetical protein
MGWVKGECATVNRCTEKAAGYSETSATKPTSVRPEKTPKRDQHQQRSTVTATSGEQQAGRVVCTNKRHRVLCKEPVHKSQTGANSVNN